MNASTDQSQSKKSPDRAPDSPKTPIAETNAPGQWHPKLPERPTKTISAKRPADYFLG